MIIVEYNDDDDDDDEQEVRKFHCLTLLTLSLWLSGLIRSLSQSTCWALLADDLCSNPGRSVSFQLVGLMAGML